MILTVVALVLMLVFACYAREKRARADDWETFPWFVYLGVIAFVFTWPAWIVVALVLPRKTL